jgi:hypothetical protein
LLRAAFHRAATSAFWSIEPWREKVLNKAVVSQARKFVWATDDSQLSFVRRYIGTAPDRTILTEKQKREALAAARGELVVENGAH